MEHGEPVRDRSIGWSRAAAPRAPPSPVTLIRPPSRCRHGLASKVSRPRRHGRQRHVLPAANQSFTLHICVLRTRHRRSLQRPRHGPGPLRRRRRPRPQRSRSGRNLARRRQTPERPTPRPGPFHRLTADAGSVRRLNGRDRKRYRTDQAVRPAGNELASPSSQIRSPTTPESQPPTPPQIRQSRCSFIGRILPGNGRDPRRCPSPSPTIPPLRSADPGRRGTGLHPARVDAGVVA